MIEPTQHNDELSSAAFGQQKDYIHPPSGTTGAGGMRLFAELFVSLGTSTKTNDKLDALTEYFTVANDRDKVWVIALFSGRKPKRTVNATQLAEWSREITGLP